MKSNERYFVRKNYLLMLVETVIFQFRNKSLAYGVNPPFSINCNISFPR